MNKLWTEDNDEIIRLYWGREPLQIIADRINVNQRSKAKPGKRSHWCGLGSVGHRAHKLGLCSAAERDAAIKEARRRPSIPAKLRKEVLARDRNRCLKCRSTKSLQMDHIYPVRFGGETSADNLQTLCRRCNRKKSIKIVDYRSGRPKYSDFPLNKEVRRKQDR